MTRGLEMTPVAIVGEGCVLPGALSPEALWDLVSNKRSAITPTSPTLWRLDAGADRDKLAQEIVSETGGYVHGFAFDPSGFSLDPSAFAGLDEVFLYTLSAAKDALLRAGIDPKAASPRGAVILGNLSYPTPGLVALALSTWKNGGAHDGEENPKNRYMSGLPAHLVAKAVGFSGGAFALDAACASSLYAVKLACDRLNDGACDVALAGGVNHADDLFLHGGFSALRALSPTGQSRPFHHDADGLVPAQGTAMLVLMRLADAVAQGKNILGVIRGVGLSNDGKSRGLMVPTEEAQVRAMRSAYAISGISPDEISLVECHATGTVVGDGAELRSMREVFGTRGLAIGSIKSNMGHLITASGGAGIIKVLAAMRNQVRPPSLHAEVPNGELHDGAFRVLHEAEPWPSEGPRRAAISNFGFGGNNAHIVLEEWQGQPELLAATSGSKRSDHSVAVVAQSVRTGSSKDAVGLVDAFFTSDPAQGPSLTAETPCDTISIEAAGLRFPPSDLRAALSQQLLLLAAAEDLESVLAKLGGERTSIFVGMQTDAEVSRHAIRWCGERPWVGAISPALANEGLTGAAVIGCMPNIVANRLSHQLDLRGPSFSVSSEELSGNMALELGLRALRHGEIDAAVIGAVDLSCEPVSRAAGREALSLGRNVPGDAAVLMVLKRHADALRDGDTVLAIIGASDTSHASSGDALVVTANDENPGLSAKLGHAHAASGLLHVAAAVEACAHRALPSRAGAMPWLPSSGGEKPSRNAYVHVTSTSGESAAVSLHAPFQGAGVPLFLGPRPAIRVYAAATREGLLAALAERRDSTLREGASADTYRVAITAEDEATLDARIDHAATLIRAMLEETRVGFSILDDGIYFGNVAPSGELSFVYTGAAGAYPHMGRDLALGMPDLVDSFAGRARSVRDAAGWVYTDDPTFESTPMDKLWGASYLAQLHTELTRKAMNLRPTAIIGYCSGETNSLFALDAWDDLDGFRRDVSESHVYDRELCGELLCLRSAWQLDPETPAEWSTWRIRANATDVEAALANEERVHLVIINAAQDVVIAGDPAGCARVGAVFGRKAQRTLGYDFIMHCREAREFESRWRALHTRPTKPVPGVRFYTHSTLGSYEATTETVANALTGQAMNRVNFPALVEKAYADGVRVFIEHGPHAGCTKWISDTLGDREHLAIALDRFGHSSLFQGIECAAKLFAAGVPVSLAAITAALAPRAHGPLPKPRSLRITVPAHPEAVAPAPEREARATSTRMNLLEPRITVTPREAEMLPAAPWLASVLGMPAVVIAAENTSISSQIVAAPSARPSVPQFSTAVASAPRSEPPAPPSFVPMSPPETPFAPSPAYAPQPLTEAPLMSSSSPPDRFAAHAPAPSTSLDALTAHHEHLAELHRAFLRQQVAVQSHFVNVTMAPLNALVAQAPAQGYDAPHASLPEASRLRSEREATYAATQAHAAAAAPAEIANVPVYVAPPAPTPIVAPPPTPKPATNGAHAKNGTNGSHALAVPAPAARVETIAAPVAKSTKPLGPTKVAPPRKPTGLALDRKGLEVHSSGKISEIFGPLFAQQDGYARQVRMPEPPLLLADRVLGIEGEPGTMGTGTVWTETDVTESSWYLHEGRMPAGIMVESGQADLLLISWLGADFENKGDRVYRLLGCELKSHGPLPTIGDTLHYEISVDGHAEQNGIRLFFFHYNCWVNGELRMSVRSGQAGFFTYDELAGSAGVLWSAETSEPKKDARLDPPAAITTKRSLSKDEVGMLAQGRIHEVFGPEFARADTHTRTPVFAGDKMRLLDEVEVFEPQGGPWKRGYLRAKLHLSPDAWFFQGHFKNDPCMPGTLMLEGGLQAMQILMTGLGHTLDHDGSRFEPMPEQNYSLRCRGQAIPSSKEVVYEIFVEEIHGGAEPVVFAEIMGSVDGRKAFHCKRMALRLVPAWPLDAGRMKVEMPRDDKPVAIVDGFKFDYASLLACAWGRPSEAFGPMYARFDSPRRVARLPGPPYHFMSRVPRVEGKIGGLEVGSVAVIDYDVPRGEWYFPLNAADAMPFAVMLETALQPCGWLASYAGGALAAEENLYFRNLDGTGTQHREITDDVGTLAVTTKLTSVSESDGIVIMGFDVKMHAGTEEIYTLKTVFGFFPGDTMKNQLGLPTTPEQRAALGDPSDAFVDLTSYPARYFGSTLRLGKEDMLMIERITGLWLTGEKAGKAGIGRIRAEKSIVAKQWFFKAHFYQDPVQPGSLGIEAMLQALQALAIELGAGEGITNPRFETQASGVAMSWKYRGQVIPENDTVVVDIVATEVRRENGTVTVVGGGSLWVDGKRIYEAKGLAVRVLPGA